MNDTNTPLYTDQSGEKGIVLNRMYTGSYLSSNLGHEVINMFQADDDNYYLYLNAKGNFAAEGIKVGTMLLVRGIGKGSIEVVGMATKLKRVNSANNPLSRDLGVINEQVRKEQDIFLESITYGTVPILDVFGEGGQRRAGACAPEPQRIGLILTLSSTLYIQRMIVKDIKAQQKSLEKEIKKDMPSRLHARRQMLKTLYAVTEVPTEAAGRKRNTKKVDLPAKLFNEIAPKYENRNGGYTRIIKIGQRKGDGAMEVVLELV